MMPRARFRSSGICGRKLLIVGFELLFLKGERKKRTVGCIKVMEITCSIWSTTIGLYLCLEPNMVGFSMKFLKKSRMLCRGFHDNPH